MTDENKEYEIEKSKEYPTWERISDDTWRLRIFEGWIVRHAMSNNMTFVPDKEHKWSWIYDVDNKLKLRIKNREQK